MRSAKSTSVGIGRLPAWPLRGRFALPFVQLSLRELRWGIEISSESAIQYLSYTSSEATMSATAISTMLKCQENLDLYEGLRGLARGDERVNARIGRKEERMVRWVCGL